MLGRGLDRGWSLNVFATPVLWRRTLGILLPWTSYGWCFPPSPLSRCGRSLFFKVLADYRVTGLVTVMLVAQRMLLLHPGIPVS